MTGQQMIMAHYDFDKDREMGENAQTEAIERIKKEFTGIEILESHSKNKEFDIKGSYKNRKITFEIKWDIMAEKTGNVAIEYESRGKKSGIQVTIADYWIYKIKDEFYLIETNKIKEGIAKKLFHRNVTGGDAGSFTRMYLVKVPLFISLGKNI